VNEIIGIVVGFGLLVGVGFASGVVGIDPGWNSETVAGQFDVPQTEVNDTRFTDARLAEDEVDIEIDYWIDNPNPVGAVIDLDYDLYWAETEDGQYRPMGRGNLTEEIPQNANISNTTETTMTGSEAVDAETTRRQQGYVWVRVDAQILVREFAASDISYSLETEVRVE